jgi:DNA-binding Lrp family transcriptional regulator
VDLEHLDLIAAELTRLPETTMVAETMGRYDFIIFIAASSIQSLRHLVSGHIAAIPGVRETETFVTPALHKSVREWRLEVPALPPG